MISTKNNNDNSLVFANTPTFDNLSINEVKTNTSLTISLNTIFGNINTSSGNINTISGILNNLNNNTDFPF